MRNPDTPADTLVQVITTVETHAQATQIAQSLVENRLAACVQLDGPIESHYVWDGALTSASEWRLTAKSLTERVPDLQRHLRQIHPYKVPEIVVLVIDDAGPEYVEWVRDSLLHENQK